MTDVKKLFINTLKPFGHKIILQGSMAADEKYPDNFFTFFNNSTESETFYDDVENATVWDFDLNFYSNKAANTNSVLLEAKKKLKAAGFIVNGKGYDVASDEPSHTGRGINVLYIERED